MAPQGICKIDGCGNGGMIRRGWCLAHYDRWRRHGDPLGGRITMDGEPMRFFQEVALPYEGEDCLFWPYARDAKGYAQVHVDGRATYVSRLACEARHGPPPTLTHQAAHSCGKGHEGCVNQMHLRWATSKENKADMLIHSGKLTESEVRFARQMRGMMTQTEIAAKIGVARETVCRIQLRKIWAWLI